MPVQIVEIKGKNGVIYLFLRWTEDHKRCIRKTRLHLVQGMRKRDKDKVLLIADQMRVDLEKELERKKFGDYLPQTVRAEEDFLVYLRQMVKEKDRDFWRNTLAHVITYVGNRAVTLADITPEWCLGFQNHLKKVRKKNGKPLEPSTIEKYVLVLNSCLISAVNNGVIPRNPMMNDKFRKKKIKVPEKPVNFLQIEDIKKLIRAEIPKSDKDIKEAFLFSVLTGLRISDIDVLTFGQVRDGAIHITMRKTDTAVYIPIVEGTQLLIDHQKLKYPKHKNGDRIFQIGWKNVINKPIHKWRTEAGVNQHFSFHSARRSCATLLFNVAECEERVVKGILGHKQSRKDVFARYAQVSDRLKRDALKTLSDLFIEDLKVHYSPSTSSDPTPAASTAATPEL